MLNKILKNIGFIFFPLYFTRGMTLYIKNNTPNKELVGVELGTGLGRNAKRMLLSLPIEKLYCVEPNDIDKTKKYLNRFSNKVVFLHGNSLGVVHFIPDNLDFIYLDTDHHFTEKELELYYPKLKDGGIMGGHDFNILPVINPVLSFAKKNNQKVFTGKDNDWWMER